MTMQTEFSSAVAGAISLLRYQLIGGEGALEEVDEQSQTYLGGFTNFDERVIGYRMDFDSNLEDHVLTHEFGHALLQFPHHNLAMLVSRPRVELEAEVLSRSLAAEYNQRIFLEDSEGVIQEISESSKKLIDLGLEDSLLYRLPELSIVLQERRFPDFDELSPAMSGRLHLGLVVAKKLIKLGSKDHLTLVDKASLVSCRSSIKSLQQEDRSLTRAEMLDFHLPEMAL